MYCHLHCKIPNNPTAGYYSTDYFAFVVDYNFVDCSFVDCSFVESDFVADYKIADFHTLYFALLRLFLCLIFAVFLRQYNIHRLLW